MKSDIPVWANLSEIMGLFLLGLGTCAYIKAGFVPESLQAPGYPFALSAVGVLMGAPKLYLSLKSARQKMQ